MATKKCKANDDPNSSHHTSDYSQPDSGVPVDKSSLEAINARTAVNGITLLLPKTERVVIGSHA